MTVYVRNIVRKAAFTPGQHDVARQQVAQTSNLYPDTYNYVDGHMLPGNKLLVRDTC